MILSNDTEFWKYVNGDLANIIEYDKKDDTFKVRLLRNKDEVTIWAHFAKKLVGQGTKNQPFSK